ncbi:tail fiber protein [Beggiatoa leptomitoformis]|uniref:Tail fiber protein n=2 Tax=Beggiatoa leptomitoformis TaxID=288004 RepID=A0A2N9YIU9_9GAMM|nr:tail fiber protein [Beggiatoa leptomitoformis]AUI70430.1 tail fiber protein [Beggiatoa leptomitoformis]
MDPILGMVCLFPWNWDTAGWAKCNGRLLQISQNPALYSLLGNEFGGTPGQTFALPSIPAIKTANGGDVDYYIATQGVYPYRE